MTESSSIARVSVAEEDHARLRDLVSELARVHHAVESPAFLRSVQALSATLPDNVRETLAVMRYQERYAAVVVENCPIRLDPGPTPAHWLSRDPDATSQYDFWLALVLAQMGDLIGLQDSQQGRLRRDVLPVEGAELQQSGHGSDAELVLHVDDALDDDRGDTFALLCLRAADGGSTVVAPMGDLDLRGLDAGVMSSPRFTFLGDGLRRSRALLFGAQESPYVRLDPPYTEVEAGDARALRAHHDLHERLRAASVDVITRPGDVLLIDNYRCVHGRRSFVANYDGQDRWLIKMTATKDLRRSRGRRDAPDARMIRSAV